MFCIICAVQIQPRKHVLSIDHAGHSAPARQHELDHTDQTDQTDHTDQEYICPEISRSFQVGIDHTDHLPVVWNTYYYTHAYHLFVRRDVYYTI